MVYDFYQSDYSNYYTIIVINKRTEKYSTHIDRKCVYNLHDSIFWKDNQYTQKDTYTNGANVFRYIGSANSVEGFKENYPEYFI